MPARRDAQHTRGGAMDAGGEAQDWVAVGEVAAPFGMRGELKVRPLTDFPERFAHTETLYAGEDHTPYAVETARLHGAQVVVRLAGIASVEAAEALRGEMLWIPASELMPLPQDSYYLHDLVGLRVRHVNGRVLGVVGDVLTGVGNDLLVVRDPQTGAETLLPAVKAFIKRVDVAGGELLVEPVPGLFDDRFEEAR
ncbi:MAG TPA: ribosome maturation factor RimM [Ktedonobacterales bacterium]